MSYIPKKKDPYIRFYPTGRQQLVLEIAPNADVESMADVNVFLFVFFLADLPFY